MKRMETSLDGLLLLESIAHVDNRGFFLESFNARRFENLTNLDVSFVQDNHSQSTLHVLRGLHYQADPGAQGKLVRAVRGRVFDVAVDISRSSRTFGAWVRSRSCPSENHKQLWIPPRLSLTALLR